MQTAANAKRHLHTELQQLHSDELCQTKTARSRQNVQNYPTNRKNGEDFSNIPISHHDKDRFAVSSSEQGAAPLMTFTPFCAGSSAL